MRFNIYQRVKWSMRYAQRRKRRSAVDSFADIILMLSVVFVLLPLTILATHLVMVVVVLVLMAVSVVKVLLRPRKPKPPKHIYIPPKK